MAKQKYDDEGILKLAAGIFQQTKSDYIIGKILMIRKLRNVVSFEAWNKEYRKNFGPDTVKRIDLYFDAKNLIEKDPYGVISGISDPRTIFKNWDKEVNNAISYGTTISKSSVASATKLKNI